MKLCRFGKINKKANIHLDSQEASQELRELGRRMRTKARRDNAGMGVRRGMNGNSNEECN